MLIFLNGKYLQALEKIATTNSWVTLVLMVLFMGVVLLKAIDAIKLKGSFLAIFNSGFIEKESEKKAIFFDVFQIVIFTFSVIVISLVAFILKGDVFESNNESFISFLLIFLSLLLYFFAKKVLEYLFTRLFLIKNQVNFFNISKSYYLYTISFFLYIAIVLNTFAGFKQQYLYYYTAFLFALRFVFHVVNNKKLIFKRLFYFILYICAFEIAPLFLLFKLMF